MKEVLTTYRCKECESKKFIECNDGYCDPIVKCDLCGIQMVRALPNWLKKIKLYKEKTQ